MRVDKKKRVVVAISGGVDSSTSAFLLKQKGYEVIGVFMRLGTDSYYDEMAARKTCQRLDIKFYPVNFKNIFSEEIIKYFLDSYREGLTPNPCARCNNLIKFGELLKVAESMDAYLATGHYARVEKKNGLYHLYRGKDIQKDQSYFLYNLKQHELKSLIFPLAESEKKEIKLFAKEKNILHKPGESQDICFLNVNGNIIEHNEFLKKHITLKPGPIKTKDEKEIGEHKGLPLYTIGQRKGVEIGGVGPFYVVQTDYDSNTLYVTNGANDKSLFSDTLYTKKINWVSGIEPKFPLSCQAMIRYRHKSADCVVLPDEKKGFIIKFKDNQRAITNGQCVVLYEGDEVLGGGIIS